MDRAVDAKGHRVAELLDGFCGPQRQDHRLAAVRLDQPHSLFDAALLVRADGESQVARLEGLRITGEHHPPSGQRHSLNADQDTKTHDRIRRFSGSNTGVGPATATVTG